MMSLSMRSSFSMGAPVSSRAAGPTNWMRPSPLRSSKSISPVASQLWNHSGTSA